MQRLHPSLSSAFALLCGLGALMCTLAPSAARADGPFEGQWREGQMRIQVAITSWGGDCGPRPRSTTIPGGGAFRVAQSGDQLTFHMRRQRTTRSCWSENRAVRRVSSSYQAGTWRIVCRTPTGDPRAETGTYTLRSIGNDQLSFRDVSQYDWQLNDSRCVGTITTTQNFTRIGQSPPPTPPPTKTEPPPQRCEAGAPTSLRLRPRTAQLQPGEHQCFVPRAFDAANCAVPVRGARLVLADGTPGRLIDQGAHPAVQGANCYQASETERAVQVRAEWRNLSATALITVRSLDLSDLIARRAETGSVGGGTHETEASATPSAGVIAQPPAEAGSAPFWLWWVLGGASFLVLLGAFVLVRSRRRPGHIGGLPAMAGAAETANATDAPRPNPRDAPKGEDRICPVCRRGYPPGTTICEDDGAQLVDYSEFLARSETETTAASRCPVCGKVYPAGVRFCGEDGATLVPIDPGE